ncbi:MAG: hypothetical protein M1820_005502 [Bogoriella megaspora]|nr:MAG: hypothetical protein M1820_005502 [Bogoriella megaspora]
MDPGTAVGVVSLGIQCCQGLAEYYGCLRDRDAVLESLLKATEGLGLTLTILRDILKGPLKPQLVDRVTNDIDSCELSLATLNLELEKVRSKSAYGFQEKLRELRKKAVYPFKEGTLNKLKRLVDDLRDNLMLSLVTLQVDAGNVLNESIRKLQDESVLAAAEVVAIKTELQRISNSSSIIGTDVKNVLTVVTGLTSSSRDHSRALRNTENSVGSLAGQIDRIGSSIDIAEQRRELAAQASNRRNVLNWLKPVNTFLEHSIAQRKRDPATGNWFLTSAAYERWKNEPGLPLWINGGMGCGKTILTSVVIEDMRSTVGVGQSSIIAFFYFTFSDNQKQRYASMLSSMILQLSGQGEVPSSLQALYEKREPSPPTVEELYDVLESLMKDYANIYLVFDALDECRTESDFYNSEDILRWLSRVSEVENVHMLATSRKESEIEYALSSWASFPITSSDNSLDIETYVRNQIEGHRKLGGDSIKENIVKALTDGANGMFRWVACQLDMLKKLRLTSPAHIHRTLTSLPPTLDETYIRILQGLETCQQEAYTALQWLAFSVRPLSMKEVAEACIVDTQDHSHVDEQRRFSCEEIFDLLPSLVTQSGTKFTWDRRLDYSFSSGSSYKQDTGYTMVQLAHMSVKDYLTSDRIRRSAASAFAMEASLSNKFLAESCLAYISHYSESLRRTETANDLLDFHLVTYACQHWADHFRLCGENTIDQLVNTATQNLTTDLWLNAWLQIYMPSQPSQPPFYEGDEPEVESALYYAVCLNLEQVLENLTESKESASAWSIYDYGYAIREAVESGSIRSLRRLLDCSPPFDLDAKVVLIRETIQRNDAFKFELLLSSFGDLESVGWASESNNLLSVACDCDNLPFAQTLLKKGASIDTTGKTQLNPLCKAVYRSNDVIVDFLLAAGADINAPGGEYGTPLMDASCSGNVAMVEKLLNAGADINARVEPFGTALHMTAHYGFEEVIKTLIAAGADVNSPNGVYGDGSTLGAAKERRHTRVVELLVSAGAVESNLQQADRLTEHAQAGAPETFTTATLDYDNVASHPIGRDDFNSAGLETDEEADLLAEDHVQTGPGSIESDI